MVKPTLSATTGVLIGTMLGLAFFLGGYLLCAGKHTNYGTVMFLLVPFVSGLSIAVLVGPASLVAACSAATCILSLVILVSFGLEGYICCLMSLPILLLGMAIGAVVGYVVRRRFLDNNQSGPRNTLMLLLVCPFLMAAANQAEKPWREMQRIETFSDETVVPTSPEKTWELLVRMPHMYGPLPFLLWFGLPVPEHCTLESDATGAVRTCYFNQGVIEQQVTNWQKPGAVGFKITKSTLPGRRWLTFVDADYVLTADGSGTKVVRRTTIASRLYPRWYWRPFEEWGVSSEHSFVLSSLQIAARERMAGE